MFGRVIPKTQGATPTVIAPPGWKDQILRAMPCALEWSGLIYADVHMHKGAKWEESWWKSEYQFEKDHKVHAKNCGCCAGMEAGMIVVMRRQFGKLYTLVEEHEESKDLDLGSLTPDQCTAFDITDAMVSGQESLGWQLWRPGPISIVGKKRKAEDS